MDFADSTLTTGSVDKNDLTETASYFLFNTINVSDISLTATIFFFYTNYVK